MKSTLELPTTSSRGAINAPILCSTIRNRLLYYPYLSEEEQFIDLKNIQERKAPTKHFMDSLISSENAQKNRFIYQNIYTPFPFNRFLAKKQSY